MPDFCGKTVGVKAFAPVSLRRSVSDCGNPLKGWADSLASPLGGSWHDLKVVTDEGILSLLIAYRRCRAQGKALLYKSTIM
jgi:hypothetical protein